MNTLHIENETTATTATTDGQASASVKRSSRIEAYGVKGMKSRPWRRTFKDADALSAWCEKNDAEVYGQRFVDDR
jgi:hypothetical protein